MSERWKASKLKLSSSASATDSYQSPAVDRMRTVERIAAKKEQAEQESKWQLPKKSSARHPRVVHARAGPVLKALREGVMGRCLLMHKWAIHTETRRDVRGFYVKSVIPYRTCERCGRMQRGIFDTFWRDIVWEPLRKGTDISSGRNRFFRQPSSPLDQLAHSWGLRRSRAGDRKVSEDAAQSPWGLTSMRSSGRMIRCLFAHEWVRQETSGRSSMAYRICGRCGTMQRAFDIRDGEISWQAIRERADVEPEPNRFVRQHSSRLDQLAHSLGLRRSRMSDGGR